MAFCVNCGYSLPEGSKFCAECGTPVPKRGKRTRKDTNTSFHIISLNCPHCKAPLQVNAELSRATCEYCGNSFVLEDEVKKSHEAGLAYERGRMAAANLSAGEAAEKVARLRRPIKELNRISEERRTIDFKLRQGEARIKELNKKTIPVLLWLGGGFSVFLGILFMSFLRIGGGGLLTGLILLGVFALSAHLYKVYAEKKSMKVEEEMSALESRKQELGAKRQKILKENDVAFIPEKYRSMDAMNYFYDALSSMRAVSLQQAISLYEEELHRRNMIAMQEEQIRLQQMQIEAQKEQTKTLKEQQQQLKEMEENRREENTRDVVGGIIGSVVSAGIGIAIGKGIGKLFDDL